MIKSVKKVKAISEFQKNEQCLVCGDNHDL